jgi:hypothetical protein
MKLENLLELAANEPEQTLVRTVWITPPGVLEKARKGGIALTSFLSAPGRRPEERTVRYHHILGPPASPQAIDAWERTRRPLPAPLRELVSRVNGIHLWADVATGRSYVGLAPIEEWETARVKLGGDLDDRYIAISYHADGASFVVLDFESGICFLMDVSGPETTTPIASDIGGLLDWLWRTRIAPKP